MYKFSKYSTTYYLPYPNSSRPNSSILVQTCAKFKKFYWEIPWKLVLSGIVLESPKDGLWGSIGGFGTQNLVNFHPCFGDFKNFKKYYDSWDLNFWVASSTGDGWVRLIIIYIKKYRCIATDLCTSSTFFKNLKKKKKC